MPRSKTTEIFFVVLMALCLLAALTIATLQLTGILEPEVAFVGLISIGLIAAHFEMFIDAVRRP